MPVARQRHTKARRDRARVHLKLKEKNLVACSKCGEKIPAHKACPKCGTYRKREAIDTLKKIEKKQK